MQVPHMPDKTNILTVALEDYYQVGVFNRLIQHGQWYRFETRFEQNAQKTLELLERHQIKATFFVLGWIADEYPEIVRRVAEAGHEVASKGYYHRSIRQMTPAEFREDLARSREALERASGTLVLGYRVAHEWLQPDDLWALDVLIEEGYAYDSSICPTLRHFAHQPWRAFAHQHVHRDGRRRIWEFPLSVWKFLGIDIPIAGGNYFRQFPHRLVRHEVDRWIRRQPHPFVMYFHIWELDPGQPKIEAASRLNRMRHYRHLERMGPILEDYFNRYRFTSVARHLGLDTSQAHVLPDATRPDGFEDARDAARQLERDKLPAWLSRSNESGGEESPPADTRTPVTIVIPCFNEELILLYLANTLQSVVAELGRKYDIRLVFVDDGSSDATWTSLHKIFDTWPNVKILRHKHNQGVAAAVLTGIQRADTEIVCSIDCDCTYDPHELGAMIPLLAPDVDLVTASPYHPQGQVRNVPRWRLSLSKGASFLYRRALRQRLHTYTSCFRVYRRSAIIGLDIENKGFLGIAEILGQLDLKGSRIVEYPTTLEVRMLGRSKMKTLRMIVRHLGLMGHLLRLRLGPPSSAAPQNNEMRNKEMEKPAAPPGTPSSAPDARLPEADREVKPIRNSTERINA